MSSPPDTATPAPGRGSRLPHPGRSRDPEGRMPLMEHLRELRNRLIKAVLGLIVGMAVGWLLYKPAFNFIIGPYCRITIQHTTGCVGPDTHPLVVTGVFDPFFVKLKVAFVVGLIVSSPIWFYQLWAFISPGLYRREKRWAFAFVGAAMLLIFGIAFELPLVLVMLNMAGAVSHAFIRKYRRVMIFLVFVFAGAATPSPDPFSMLLLAVPCVILVEVAELFVWLNDRRRARRDAALLAAEGLSEISEE